MRSIVLLLIVAVVSGCASGPEVSPADDTEIITGRVLDVHMLGKKKEIVTVCHFDPRFVVTVQTDSGVRNLAIHSPAQAFVGEDPIGKNYKFELSKSGNTFLLMKAEEVVP